MLYLPKRERMSLADRLAQGWTVVATFPFELVENRPKGGNAMGLAIAESERLMGEQGWYHEYSRDAENSQYVVLREPETLSEPWSPDNFPPPCRTLQSSDVTIRYCGLADALVRAKDLQVFHMLSAHNDTVKSSKDARDDLQAALDKTYQRGVFYVTSHGEYLTIQRRR